MFNQHPSYIIAIVLAVPGVFLRTITFIGISRMHSIKGQIETIVRQNNVQTELVSTMRTIARERVVNLYSMMMREDPFEKDEAFQLYKNYATEFVKARGQLQGMRLSDDERKVLQESLHMIAQTSASQEHVVKLVESGDTLAAQHVLLEEVIPAQDKIFVQYSRLLDMQRNSVSQSMAEADASFRFATLFMLLSDAFAVLVVMGVTAYVIGRTREVEN